MNFSTSLRKAEKHLATHDPVLQDIIKRYGTCRITPHTDHYGALVSAIIGQQLSEKAGATIEKRFMGLWDNRLPSPQEILSMNPDTIRAVGVSYAKITYMKDLARHIEDGLLDMHHISSLPNEQIIQKLTDVKGIGTWTAHMFMIFSLGRLDVLPTGDLGVRKAMHIQYGLASLPSPSEMQKVAEQNNWHPYESIASWYMWQSLNNT